MPIELSCTQCGRKLRVADDAAGKQARCPACGQVSRVPESVEVGAGPSAPPAGQPTFPTPAHQSSYPPPKPAPLANPFSDPAPETQSPFGSQGVNPFGDAAPSKGSANPYQAPGAYGYQRPSVFQYPLASRGKRLGGAILDSLFYMGAAAPGFIFMIVNSDSNNDELALIGMGIMLAGLLVVGIVNWVMISTSGQSIAKRILGMRILMLETGQLPGFVNGVLLRIWVPALVNQACSLFGLVDALWIFNEERRCIHDLIARTVVVDV